MISLINVKNINPKYLVFYAKQKRQNCRSECVTSVLKSLPDFSSVTSALKIGYFGFRKIPFLCFNIFHVAKIIILVKKGWLKAVFAIEIAVCNSSLRDQYICR